MVLGGEWPGWMCVLGGMHACAGVVCVPGGHRCQGGSDMPGGMCGKGGMCVAKGLACIE